MERFDIHWYFQTPDDYPLPMRESIPIHGSAAGRPVLDANSRNRPRPAGCRARGADGSGTMRPGQPGLWM
jgi:hypothetical protein